MYSEKVQKNKPHAKSTITPVVFNHGSMAAWYRNHATTGTYTYRGIVK
jgi:hypothetical protein